MLGANSWFGWCLMYLTHLSCMQYSPIFVYCQPFSFVRNTLGIHPLFHAEHHCGWCNHRCAKKASALVSVNSDVFQSDCACLAMGNRAAVWINEVLVARIKWQIYERLQIRNIHIELDGQHSIGNWSQHSTIWSTLLTCTSITLWDHDLHLPVLVTWKYIYHSANWHIHNNIAMHQYY